MRTSFLICLFSFLGSLSVFAGGTWPVRSLVVNGHNILANRNELTAYVFDNDKDGVLNCYGSCATAWPPILLQAGDIIGAPLATITREDGAQQITYKGRPIYLFSGDRNPGDLNGDGLDGVWHIIDLQ